MSYTLGYDGEGQLISITGGSGGTTNTTFAYDAGGRRVSRTAGGTTTTFVYSGSQILQEQQGSVTTALYLYGNELVGRKANGVLESYFYDALGSNRQTTSNTGAVTSSRTYEAFGQTVASSGGANYGFAATSGYRDDGDAGLVHVGARYYDNQVGRFISRDTYLDQKPYSYCEHDPINHLDPTGHYNISLFVVGGIMAVLAIPLLVAGFGIAAGVAVVGGIIVCIVDIITTISNGQSSVIEIAAGRPCGPDAKDEVRMHPRLYPDLQVP